MDKNDLKIKDRVLSLEDLRHSFSNQDNNLELLIHFTFFFNIRGRDVRASDMNHPYKCCLICGGTNL